MKADSDPEYFYKLLIIILVMSSLPVQAISWLAIFVLQQINKAADWIERKQKKADADAAKARREMDDAS